MIDHCMKRAFYFEVGLSLDIWAPRKPQWQNIFLMLDLLYHKYNPIITIILLFYKHNRVITSVVDGSILKKIYWDYNLREKC